MVDKQFASGNNLSPEPWTGPDTRDRGIRCLIAPRFLALSGYKPCDDAYRLKTKRKAGMLSVAVKEEEGKAASG